MSGYYANDYDIKLSTLASWNGNDDEVLSGHRVLISTEGDILFNYLWKSQA